MTGPGQGLIADIGGTNMRIALVGPDGVPLAERSVTCSDFADPMSAILAYLSELGAMPRRAALAVASPVVSDRIELTNRDWSFSISRLKQQLRLELLTVVNDFEAVALSVPHLTQGDKAQIGGGQSIPGAPVGIIGPGTGLGVSAFIPSPSGSLSMASEGGHVSLSPRGARESAIALWLEDKHGHVSAERVVSGPGLVTLHEAIAGLDGVPNRHTEPDQISEGARAQSCLTCAEALNIFFSLLGTTAGNLALSLGARGGILIAGGIVPRMLDMLHRSRFRERFEDKGRFRPYLQAIRTEVITHPYPAFLGLVGLVQ